MQILDTLGRDLRDAVRQLRATPIVTAVAVASLALGIGANTAIFSLVNAMLIRGLPVHAPEMLVELNDSATNPIWEALRARQDAFTGVMAYSSTSFNLARRGPARMARGMLVNGGAFDVLGLQPALGRLIAVEDDRRDGGPSGPIAVLSYGFWQREYGALPTVIGQTISLDGHAFTIAGVTPAGFSGLVVGDSFDVAVPINTQAILRGDLHMLDERGAYWLFVVGRLAPGQSLEAAQARLRAIQPQIREATMPANWPARDLEHYLNEPLTLQPAGGFGQVRRRYTQPLLVLMGIVALVLLIACANLANLLLARAAARRRELAVRLSLGASRIQLVRQLLVESLLLAFVGAAAGLAAAQAGSRLLVRMISTRTNTVFLDLTIDWRVLGFSLAVATATGLLFGLAPAFRGTALVPADALRQGGRSVVAGQRRFGVGQILVATQVALSLMLVFAATLFVRSFSSLATEPLGFDARRLLAVHLDLSQVGADHATETQIIERVIDRLRGVPGATAAAGSMITPVSAAAWMLTINVEGYTPKSDRDGRSYFNGITPSYFRTLGTPLIAGRDFSTGDREGSPRVVIVNQAFARKFLPGRNPIGATFRAGNPPRSNEVTIVGLVGDAKYRNLREESSPTAYVPIAQQRLAGWNVNAYVRTDLAPMSLTSAVTSAVADVHPDIVIRFQTVSEVVGAAMMSERVIALLSAFFGVLALLLAMMGLYGVMSYAVTRRRNEIGVRMALGAAPGRVLGMVMRDVLLVTGIGVIAGAAAGLASGRAIATLLYGLAPTDLVTLLIAIGVLAAAAICAGYVPARRAAHVDPMTALRTE